MKIFEPAIYSLEEIQFLIDHVGEPPMVAMDKGVPFGVNPKAVRPVLEEFYNLDQLATHKGVDWVGFDAIRASCQTYLIAHEGWEAATRRGAPFPPTMFSWDQRGRAHRGAVDSDSGMVRTYFDQDGNRQKLGVEIESNESYVPDWIKNRKSKAALPAPEALLVDDEKGLVTCPLCQFTINYEAGVHSKQNMAKAQMAKHLIKSRKDTEAHRTLYAAVFGAADPATN